MLWREQRMYLPVQYGMLFSTFTGERQKPSTHLILCRMAETDMSSHAAQSRSVYLCTYTKAQVPVRDGTGMSFVCRSAARRVFCVLFGAWWLRLCNQMR
jgi:hypothetical protein